MLRLFFIALLVLPACSKQSDISIKQAYGEAVNELGIFPVFPPREEFQVGDIYYWSQSTSDPSDTVSVYLTSLPWVRTEANRFLRDRVVFSGTEPEGSSPRQRDFINNGRYVETRGEITQSDELSSLSLTALPRVSVDTGFSSGIGIVNILNSIGLTDGGRTRLTLEFDDVRTYWVPNVELMPRIQTAAAVAIAPLIPAAEIELNRLVSVRTNSSNEATAPNQRRKGFSVITRVYLTRKIDYTYVNGRISSAGLRRADSILRAEQQPGRTPGVQGALVGSGLTSDGDANEGPAVDDERLEQQVRALTTRVDNLASSTTRGQSLEFYSWNARGITFRQTYQRPVAVAWDGVEFSVQRNSEPPVIVK